MQTGKAIPRALKSTYTESAINIYKYRYLVYLRKRYSNNKCPHSHPEIQLKRGVKQENNMSSKLFHVLWQWAFKMTQSENEGIAIITYI